MYYNRQLHFDVVLPGIDNSGQPTIHTTGCSSEVGSAHVHLHGGGSFLYNMFHSAMERNLKRNLKNKVCTEQLIVTGNKYDEVITTTYAECVTNFKDDYLSLLVHVCLYARLSCRLISKLKSVRKMYRKLSFNNVVPLIGVGC